MKDFVRYARGRHPAAGCAGDLVLRPLILRERGRSLARPLIARQPEVLVVDVGVLRRVDPQETAATKVLLQSLSQRVLEFLLCLLELLKYLQVA